MKGSITCSRTWLPPLKFCQRAGTRGEGRRYCGRTQGLVCSANLIVSFAGFRAPQPNFVFSELTSNIRYNFPHVQSFPRAVITSVTQPTNHTHERTPKFGRLWHKKRTWLPTGGVLELAGLRRLEHQAQLFAQILRQRRRQRLVLLPGALRVAGADQLLLAVAPRRQRRLQRLSATTRHCVIDDSARSL